VPAWLSDNLVTIVDGVAFGVLLFTIAVGLSLVFGIMDVLNLAHGALYLVGAYLAVRFVGDGQATLGAFLAAGLAAVALGAVAGAGLAVMTRPLARRGHLDQALLTLGVALIIGDLLSARFGNDVQSVPPPAFLAGSVGLAGHDYPTYRLAVIVAGLALAVLVYLLVERSRAGALLRATVADAPMVRALGVDTGRLVVAVFAFGVVLACLGGVLGAPVLGAYPGLDERVLILGLVVVVLGGLGSVPGAFLGAMVIGQVEVLGVSLLPEYASFLVFGTMAVVLLARPAGLLGRSGGARGTARVVSRRIGTPG
jgi:branched-chain amino acid transport system permease protein